MADAQEVINKLGQHIGQLYIQLAIAKVELESSAQVVVDSPPEEK